MAYFLNLLKNIDKVLLILPLFFAAVSITVITSITYDGTNLLSRMTVTQSASFIIGYIALIIALFIDYRFFERYERLVYIGAFLFQLTVYTPLGTDMSTGSLAWIDLGVTTLQPSEFVKVAFVLVFANFLSRNRDSLRTVKGLLRAVLYAAPILLVIMKEDFGSGLVLAVMCVGMVFYTGIDGRLFARLALVFCLAMPAFYRMMRDYQRIRIDAFLHPGNLMIPANWQVLQAKIAIGSGGLLGKGLFSGTQKELHFLPVQESDFIFAVAVEELGLLGGALILLLYFVLIVRVWRMTSRAKDLSGSLIAVGFLTMFAFQAVENIGMNMGVMPVTGIPLPLLSAGGSAVLANLTAIGFVLNVGIRNKTINF